MALGFGVEEFGGSAFSVAIVVSLSYVSGI